MSGRGSACPLSDACRPLRTVWLLGAVWPLGTRARYALQASHSRPSADATGVLRK